MQNLNISKLVLVVAATMAAGGACAATETASGSGTLAVSATIAPQCAVGQNTAIDFGTLVMLNGGAQSTADAVATGKLNAICTNGTAAPKFKYTSAHSSGTDFRLLGADTTTLIPYSLYHGADASTTVIAYDTATAHVDFSANGVSQVLNVTGKILAASKNLKGVQAYSDTITVTTTFDA